MPMVDTELFKIPAFSGAVLANLLTIFAFFCVLFFFSQYLQLVREYSPLKAGLAEMPATLASLLVIALGIGILGSMHTALYRSYLEVPAFVSTGILLVATLIAWKMIPSTREDTEKQVAKVHEVVNG